MELSTQEQERYERHIILPGFGPEAQHKLKAGSVLVIGAGGLGCPALTYLAASGFGHIGIVDNDIVSESNLHRQTLFTSADNGKPKAVTAQQKLSESNPFIKITPYTVQLTSENALELFREYDIILDGTDNFSTRYLVNDACVILDKPLVSGSIFTFDGQVSVFNFQGGPTYRCLFPESPAPEDMPSCSEIGVLGVLPGVIGSIMATEAVKICTGIGKVLSGRLLTYDAREMEFRNLNFSLVPENKNITSLSDEIYACRVDDEITAAELKGMLNRDEHFLLIDVRERHEFEQINIGGLNLPLSELEQLTDQIPSDGRKVIHCKSGIRSRQAITLLQKKGFTQLLNLKNGLRDWEF